MLPGLPRPDHDRDLVHCCPACPPKECLAHDLLAVSVASRRILFPRAAAAAAAASSAHHPARWARLWPKRTWRWRAEDDADVDAETDRSMAPWPCAPLPSGRWSVTRHPDPDRAKATSVLPWAKLGAVMSG